jgi:glycosyltransferase involved in cell wall biosynthesis
VKVCVDATALGSGRGGDETYVRALLAAMQVEIRPGDEYLALVRPGAEAPSGFTSQPLRRGGGIRLVTEVPRVLRRLDSPWLYLGYTHAPIPCRLPYVLVVTDLSFRHHPELYPRTARLRLNSLVGRQCRRARGVITLTAFCRDDLIEAYGLDPGRVHAVPPAVRLPADDGPPVADDTPPPGRSVLYVGNLHPRKNVSTLIRAFAVLRGTPEYDDVTLVIAGAQWWGEGAEARAAAELPGGSVRFLGRVSDVARDALIRRANVLAYPSLFEGFGLPPLEAMAVGTPVLTTTSSAIPEVVGDAAILADPLDVDGMATGLRQLLDDEQLRAELARRGRKVAASFNLRRTGLALRAALEPAWAEIAGAR